MVDLDSPDGREEGLYMSNFVSHVIVYDSRLLHTLVVTWLDGFEQAYEDQQQYQWVVLCWAL